MKYVVYAKYWKCSTVAYYKIPHNGTDYKRI